MRIADKNNQLQVLKSLSGNRKRVADLQGQAATMKKINKPSDDPVAATRVLESKTNLHTAEQFLRNSEQAKRFLEFSEQSLQELSNSLIRAKEIALSQANSGTTNAISRRAIAEEISQLYEQMNAIANRKIGDRFIFGGFQTMDRPFTDGKYTGDSGEMLIEINGDSKVAMNMPGDVVFLGKSVDPEKEEIRQRDLDGVEGLRGPASVAQNTRSIAEEGAYDNGVDIFRALKRLEISLKSDDTTGIQNSIDLIDSSINQVIMARSELGSRLNSVTNNVETLQKNVLDNKILVSSFEDADAFEVYSKLNQAEGNLKASLQTSGKLIQPSLLDFIG